MKYINKYLEYLKVVKKYSDKTIESYYDDLTLYNEFLGNNFINILDIDYDTVKEYMKYLYSLNISKSSISRKLSSIRGLYNYLVREDIVKDNYFNRINNPKKDKYLPKFLKDEEANKIFEVCKYDTPINQRNSVIIELLYATGIRVSELVNIKIKDIDFSEREIKIMGKGSKERFVFYNKECAKVLDSYLKECRSKLLNGKDSEYLFINHLGDKLTDRGIRLIIDKIVKKSCIKSKVSPHTFRHTFATMLLNEGCNIKSVQELLGHSSLGTTGIYTHLTNDEVRLAYMKAHPRA